MPTLHSRYLYTPNLQFTSVSFGNPSIMTTVLKTSPLFWTLFFPFCWHGELFWGKHEDLNSVSTLNQTRRSSTSMSGAPIHPTASAHSTRVFAIASPCLIQLLLPTPIPRLTKSYPCHFQALNKVRLISGSTYPKLTECCKSINNLKTDTTSAVLRKRLVCTIVASIYFMVGFTDFSRKPIYKPSTRSKLIGMAMCFHVLSIVPELFLGNSSRAISIQEFWKMWLCLISNNPHATANRRTSASTMVIAEARSLCTKLLAP